MPPQFQFPHPFGFNCYSGSWDITINYKNYAFHNDNDNESEFV